MLESRKGSPKYFKYSYRKNKIFLLVSPWKQETFKQTIARAGYTPSFETSFIYNLDHFKDYKRLSGVKDFKKKKRVEMNILEHFSQA